jgi:SAM-dependent methyltransferase
MNPNQALWEKGDFTRLASTMRASGEAFSKSLGVKPGMKVLDLGCGDGTTAIPSAQAGADVTGVDIARNLVEAGTARAQSLGLSTIRFQQGDACELTGIPDASFDLVVTVFGAMFAPKPLDVAREMVRVTKPGGRIVMGNWIPNDPTLVAQILKLSSAYTPAPPAGFVSPMLWGSEAAVTERFVAAGIATEDIAFARDTFTFTFDGPPGKFVDEFRLWYGPTMNAFEAAAASGKEAALQADMHALFEQQNRSGSADRTVVDAVFLRVTVTRR